MGKENSDKLREYIKPCADVFKFDITDVITDSCIGYCLTNCATVCDELCNEDASSNSANWDHPDIYK